MEIQYYENLNPGALEDKVNKVVNHLSTGDFQSADVKKIGRKLYRAKLDYTNRLLFYIGTHLDKKYIFLLEIIHNHAYEKSKFINGAAIDEDKLIPFYDTNKLQDDDCMEVAYINPEKKVFRLLDKILFLDNAQEAVVSLQPPCIIIGSAGSGKTALTLEKIRHLKGNVLYITRSPYLAADASQRYSAFGYENDDQDVAFLSFYDYLSAIDIPNGREANYQDFERWIARFNQSHKIKEPYRIFEEIKGVITGSAAGATYLTLAEYEALGIKQAIFLPAERQQVYDLFLKYKDWLEEANFYDANLLSYQLLPKVIARYHYVVVDEVQDLTTIQLSLILRSLKQPDNFIVCGDANQIVHPNFFSWTKIRNLFYSQELKENITQILYTNYRNTPEVTAIANQLLLIKIARFGSIDKESNHLVIPNSNQNGTVEFLENTQSANKELNAKTKDSTKFAVLVLRDEDKPAAQKHFSTPLLFSIHEAKGLEYENIILFNTISTYDKEFRELASGVNDEDLDATAHSFSRAKDKSDKSLEEYKFYVNALFVGITRAIKNLYIVEANKDHVLLKLLGLTSIQQYSALASQSSNNEEWQEEARRLEKQGKQGQAQQIRTQILHLKPIPWVVTTRKTFPDLLKMALDPNVFNKKSKDRLYHYLVFYELYQYAADLAELKYGPARRMFLSPNFEINAGNATYYDQQNLKALQKMFSTYGINFRDEVNFTPLMTSIIFQADNVIEYLLDNGAETHLRNNLGGNAMQMLLVLIYKYNFQEKHKNLFSRFYHRVKTESIKVKINNQLIKIGNHESEYLILNYMFANLFNQLDTGCRLQDPEFAVEGLNIKPGFQTSDFFKLFENLPESIVSENRRKPAHISGVLSKNELSKTGPGNKKLFLRLKQGIYVPHPLMEIQIEGEWVNIYDNIPMHKITEKYAPEYLENINILNEVRKQLTVA